MKTLTKLSRAILLALLAAVVCITMAVALTACNNDKSSAEDKDPVTTKYDASLKADVVMGTVGTFSMASVLNGAYVTEDNGSYTLTLTFKVGEIEVMGVKGNAFVDNAPANPTTAGNITDGTIGVYKADGTLVTEGVKVTYSSENDYTLNNAQENVYYVKSAAFPVEALTEEYEVALFVNSSMRGAQFSKDVRPATVNLDLESGAVVSSISGLGVATRGTAPAIVPDDQPAEPTYTKYDASLDADVPMGPMGTYSFDVLSSAYVTNDNGEYTVTLIFTTKTLTIATATATLFVDDNPAGVENVSFGVYENITTGDSDDSEPVTEGVVFTYGKGYVLNSAGDYVSYVTSMQFPVESLSETYYVDLYVHSDYAMGKKQFTKIALHLDLSSAQEVESISGLGNTTRLEAPYAVTSMSFVVSEVAESYNLSLYVTAFNATAISGMQFPYTSSKGVQSDSVLTIEKENGEYTAELHSVVNMGQNVEFTENLLSGITVEEVDGGYKITLSFRFDTINMPYGNVMTGYMNGASNKDYFGNVVEPVFGYYDGETLVTEGVTLTYNR